jgi:hypothetical protein
MTMAKRLGMVALLAMLLPLRLLAQNPDLSSAKEVNLAADKSANLNAESQVYSTPVSNGGAGATRSTVLPQNLRQRQVQNLRSTASPSAIVDSPALKPVAPMYVAPVASSYAASSVAAPTAHAHSSFALAPYPAPAGSTTHSHVPTGRTRIKRPQRTGVPRLSRRSGNSQSGTAVPGTGPA